MKTNKRAEVLGYIRELKKDILPYLHKDYLATRKELTFVLSNPDMFDSDIRSSMITIYRDRYKDKKYIYNFTIEMYHNLRSHLKTLPESNLGEE